MRKLCFLDVTDKQEHKTNAYTEKSEKRCFLVWKDRSPVCIYQIGADERYKRNIWEGVASQSGPHQVQERHEERGHEYDVEDQEVLMSFQINLFHNYRCLSRAKPQRKPYILELTWKSELIYIQK